jgi:4'-phosphopantetheinyl transferase
VSLHAEIGVDAEWLGRPCDAAELARRFFSPDEARSLEALSETERHDRFFRYWTLKESYVKARGLGLSIPLDRFSILLDEEPLRLHVDSALGDYGSRWRLAQLRAPAHLVAVCVDSGGAPLRVRAAHHVP